MCRVISTQEEGVCEPASVWTRIAKYGPRTRYLSGTLCVYNRSSRTYSKLIVLLEPSYHPLSYSFMVLAGYQYLVVIKV